jgi:DinB superfamily
MNTSEELARFKEEVRQRTRLVLEKVTPDQLDWMPAPQALTIRQMVRHMRLSEEGSFQVVQHGDWGYSVRRRTAPLVTLLGESEPWEAELAAFEGAHQDWLAWISAVPADTLTQELVNPQHN